jgi:hypothetical protein
MIADAQAPSPDVCTIESRANGVMLVRVRSRRDHTLPEAVFTFRVGDPQYEYWKQRLMEQESGNASATE